MFTIDQVLKATAGRLSAKAPQQEIPGVSIDSRTIKPNELFVAIQGRRFDGHDFVRQAKQRGARAVIFSNPRKIKTALTASRKKAVAMVRVKDTVQALGALAHYHRLRFKVPVVAITGSNGKTTTKDMLSKILGTGYKVLFNKGTENNHIGLPLTLLRLRKGHSIVVLEMGANHQGEIDWLSGIAQPTTAVITNIGPTHLEFFKDLKGVFRAKSELLRHLARNGKIIVNIDDRLLSQLGTGSFQKVTFGFNRFADFSGKILQQKEDCTDFLLNNKHALTLPMPGRHNVYNALASIACARCFGISYKKIRAALASFQAQPMRMQLLKANKIKILSDCYNSNPESLQCALDFFKAYPVPGRKIMVCGDMLELGQAAKGLHLEMGKRIARGKIDLLITVGPLSRNIAKGARLAGMSRHSIWLCQNAPEASQCLKKLIHNNDFVLIKGSRAMQLEEVTACFTSSSIH